MKKKTGWLLLILVALLLTGCTKGEVIESTQEEDVMEMELKDYTKSWESTLKVPEEQNATVFMELAPKGGKLLLALEGWDGTDFLSINQDSDLPEGKASIQVPSGTYVVRVEAENYTGTFKVDWTMDPVEEKPGASQEEETLKSGEWIYGKLRELAEDGESLVYDPAELVTQEDTDRIKELEDQGETVTMNHGVYFYDPEKEEVKLNVDPQVVVQIFGKDDVLEFSTYEKLMEKKEKSEKRLFCMYYLADDVVTEIREYK